MKRWLGAELVDGSCEPGVTFQSDAAWVPALLPAPGSPERWAWLQGLRRQRRLPLDVWLAAIEAGALEPQPDLITVLLVHLDGPGAVRLLSWWIRGAGAPGGGDPALLDLIGRIRDPLCAALLRQHVGPEAQPRIAAALLPLLGHQRDCADFPLLSGRVLQPGPSSLRLGALEGLALGLSAWPQPALVASLERLGRDLDATLATQAVDLLARLPLGHAALERLAGASLDPAVRRRLERRLARPWLARPAGSAQNL